MAWGSYGYTVSAQVSGTSYTSPNYGFTVTWQSPWYVANVGDDPVYDSLSIVDSNSSVYFAGVNDGSTPRSGVGDFVAYLQSDSSYANFQALAQCAANTLPYPSVEECYRYDHTYDSGAV